MTQAQFLLFLVSIIPLANYVVLALCHDSQKLLNILSKFMPILFFLHLVGLANSVGETQVYIKAIETVRGISFGLAVDEITLRFLFAFNFIWTVFAFYSHRFLRVSENKYLAEFKIFSALLIAVVNFILLSQNLLTTLFFYNFLILFCYFFSFKFFYTKANRFSRIFTFLLYLESLLFFLAIVATFKFTGRIDFVKGGILSSDIAFIKIVILLILYFSGLFLSLLLPSYLFQKTQNNDRSPSTLAVYTLFFISYALSSLYIFIKIIGFIFGFEVFHDAILRLGIGYFEAVLFLNFAVLLFFLLLSKNLKSIFFYLFFSQFVFTLLSTIFFGVFDQNKICLPLFSFLLSITLVFLSISNVILYLEKTKEKSLNGLFYDLRITVVLLIFAILNLAGLMPSASIIEKFSLFKILLTKKIIVGFAMALANCAALIFVACRLSYSFFSRNYETKSEESLAQARAIDLDSSLILTGIVTAIAILLSIIFYPLLTNFFSL